MLSLQLGRRERFQPVRIEQEQRYRHIYCLGRSGMGKTSLILNAIRQDSLGDYSIIFIDPKGEEALKAVGTIPEERKFHFISIHRKVSLNPLKLPFREQIVVDTVFEIINQVVTMATRGNQVPLTAAMRTILGDIILEELKEKQPTLERVHEKIRDYGGNPQDRQSAQRVAHRLHEVLSDPRMHHILCGQKTLNIQEVIEHGEIVFVSGADMTDAQMLMIGNIITHTVKAYCFHRTKSEEGFPAHYIRNHADLALYVDEMSDFITEKFDPLINKGRSYRVSLFMAQQGMSRTPKPLYNSLMETIGTKLCFPLGSNVANLMKFEFSDYSFNDLKNIDKYTFLARIDNKEYHLQADLPPLHDEVVFEPEQWEDELGKTEKQEEIMKKADKMPEQTEQPLQNCFAWGWYVY